MVKCINITSALYIILTITTNLHKKKILQIRSIMMVGSVSFTHLSISYGVWAANEPDRRRKALYGNSFSYKGLREKSYKYYVFEAYLWSFLNFLIYLSPFSFKGSMSWIKGYCTFEIVGFHRSNENFKTRICNLMNLFRNL